MTLTGGMVGHTTHVNKAFYEKQDLADDDYYCTRRSPDPHCSKKSTEETNKKQKPLRADDGENSKMKKQKVMRGETRTT